MNPSLQRTLSMLKFVNRICQTAFLAGAIVLSANAQQETSEEAPPQDAWAVGCSKVPQIPDRLTCQMQQTAVTETGQRVIAVSMLFDQGQYDPQITISLPHGLHLPSGINIQIDENETNNYDITTANQQGSHAIFRGDADFLRQIQAGYVMKIQMTNDAMDPVQFDLPLIGSSSAIQLVWQYL